MEHNKSELENSYKKMSLESCFMFLEDKSQVAVARWLAQHMEEYVWYDKFGIIYRQFNEQIEM